MRSSIPPSREDNASQLLILEFTLTAQEQRTGMQYTVVAITDSMIHFPFLIARILNKKMDSNCARGEGGPWPSSRSMRRHRYLCMSYGYRCSKNCNLLT